MSKKNLLGDTVLRRDHEGKLHLMNRKEGGFRSWAMPIESEEDLLAQYHVRLGAWSRDEHGEYCPVSRIPRSEQPTLHDGEESSEVLKLHDFGRRGVAPALEHSVLSPLLHEGVTEEEAMKALMGGHVRPPMVDDGFEAMDEFGFGTRLLDGLNQVAFGVGGSLLNGHRDPQALAVKLSTISPELRAEIDRMMASKGLELVPYMINGEVVRSDSVEDIRARVLEGMPTPQDDGEDSKRAYKAFVDDTDWDAISDALGPDD